MEDGSFIPSIINTPTAFPPTAWSWSKVKVSVNIPKRQKEKKNESSVHYCTAQKVTIFLHPFCHPVAPPTASWFVWQALTLKRHQHFSPATLPTCLLYYPPFWNSSLNLGSPQTTHHHYVWLQRGDESRWPCLWFWGSSSCRLRGAASGRAARDCWYRAGRSTPGKIHQKGAVCTVGIDMNNPCFLYHFLSNCVYPITFSVAFSSNSLPLCLY